MRADTSKQAYNTSSQLSRRIAEGKRKEESYREALSLQDVFSDSANLEGMQQKTSRQFKCEQGKEAQLQEKRNGKSNKSNIVGRKKLPAQKLKSKKLQMYVTEDEYSKFQDLVHASGKKTIADLLRALVLDNHNSTSIVNNVALIKQLDRLGTGMNRIGNNMNQLAKYANIQLKSGKIDQNTLNKFNDQMEQYLKEQ